MKRAIQLGTLAASNIGLAFLFQWYVLTQLGSGMATDALFAGMTLPQLILAVISGSLMHVLVPLFANENELQLRSDAWTLMSLVGGIFLALSALLYVSAPWWVPITVIGFSPESQALTIHLTRIQLIGMVFAAVTGVQWAAYHAQQKFIYAEFVPVATGLLSLVALACLLPTFGVVGAAWIATGRMVLQVLFLLPGMGRPKRPTTRSDLLNETWRRIKPLLAGTIYYKTDPVVDRMLLSTTPSGTLSLYYFAQQLYGAVMQIINKAIAAPLVPRLSHLHKRGDNEAFMRAYREQIRLVGGLGAAGLACLVLFGRPVLELALAHGNVTTRDVESLWWLMIWLGGVFWGGILGQISSTTFYAAGDTATPTRIGIYNYTCYLPAKVAAFYVAGIKGLALAGSVYYILSFLLQHRLIARKTHVEARESTLES